VHIQCTDILAETHCCAQRCSSLRCICWPIRHLRSLQTCLGAPQCARRPPVNRWVVGSSPTRGAICLFRDAPRRRPTAGSRSEDAQTYPDGSLAIVGARPGAIWRAVVARSASRTFHFLCKFNQALDGWDTTGHGVPRLSAARACTIGATAGLLACGPVLATAADGAPPARASADHIVIGVHDLAAGIREFERLTGVRPVPGGRHPGRGTHNALVSLGSGTYLEILAPVPGSDQAVEFAKFQSLTPIDWAIAPPAPPAIEELARAGFSLSARVSGSRRTDDGATLAWSIRTLRPGVGWAPFVIEWERDTAHPSTTSPGGCQARELLFSSPDSESLSRMLRIIGSPAVVRQSTIEGFQVVLQRGSRVVTLPAPRAHQLPGGVTSGNRASRYGLIAAARRRRHSRGPSTSSVVAACPIAPNFGGRASRRRTTVSPRLASSRLVPETPMRLLRTRQVIELAGLSRMTIRRMQRRGEFPHRRRLASPSAILTRQELAAAGGGGSPYVGCPTGDTADHRVASSRGWFDLDGQSFGIRHVDGVAGLQLPQQPSTVGALDGNGSHHTVRSPERNRAEREVDRLDRNDRANAVADGDTRSLTRCGERGRRRPVDARSRPVSAGARRSQLRCDALVEADDD
jgi:predicted DNA-binding transcriptional regulator AlpA